MNKQSVQTDTWLDKYKPKKMSDLITNVTAIKLIYTWLTSFDKTKMQMLSLINKKKQKTRGTNNTKKKSIEKKSCLIITGNHGVGKSITVNLILKELNYEILNADINILKHGKDIEAVIDKLMMSSNILNIMHNAPAKKVAIVIDEIASITSSAEKMCIMALQKLNEMRWYCPIIFISNNDHNKLLTDIKKASYEIKMYPPFPSDMQKILAKIATTEIIKMSPGVMEKIIEHSQGDIRRLVFTLQNIRNTYNNKVISLQIINEYCMMANKKDIDMDLYIATNELLQTYTNIDGCIRLYETEKVLLPLMIQQNYAKYVNANCKSNEDKHELIRRISESLSIGDVVENYIYGDQNWGMHEIHGFHTCVIPSYYLSEKVKCTNKVGLTFATDLNKTSIKRINKKNIINTNKCFCNMNISDYIYMNKIIKKFIIENNIKECADLLKQYNIKLEHIESLLKIDKIKNIKILLTSRQRNDFQLYLDNKL